MNRSTQKSCGSQGFFLMDWFNYSVECFRKQVFGRVFNSLDTAYHSLRSVTHPKSKTGDEEQSEAVKRVQDNVYALSSNDLSFYDQFECIDGVPAYLFAPPSAASQLQRATSLAAGELVSCITSCAFSRDSSRLVVCYSTGEVVVWDADHGNLLAHNRDLNGQPVCDAVFQQDSSTKVLVATREGVCMVWDLDIGSTQQTHFMEEFRPLEKQTIELEVPQLAQFFNEGSKVVFSSQIGDHSSYLMRLVIADTFLFPRKGAIYYLSVPVDEHIVVSKMEMSPDNRGLIVGFSDRRVEKGYCILWPDYISDMSFSRKLSKGTLGTWSPGSNLVVTWTVPEEPFPEVNDGSCAFLWNVNNVRANMMGSAQGTYEETEKLKNPYGKNVLWCSFVQNRNGKDRLVMCVIRTTARFLFWDLEPPSLTHTIATAISTNDMILGNRMSWLKSWVDRKNVKGLNPLAANKNLNQIGAVSGFKNQVVIWDAALGIQLLNITPPNSFAGAFEGGVDIIFGPSKGKFAMIGDSNIMVFSPLSPSLLPTKDPNLIESQMIELENRGSHRSEDSTYKLMFSGSGNSLGVLCIRSHLMHIWHLFQNKSCEIKTEKQNEGELMDFSLSMTGEYLVTCTRNPVVYVWDCTGDNGVVISIVKTDFVSQSIGITSDASRIVMCSESGDLVWYESSTSTEETSQEQGLPVYKTTTHLKPQGKFSGRLGSLRKLDDDGPLLSTGGAVARSSSSFAPGRVSSTGRTHLSHAETDKKIGLGVDSSRISADCSRAVRLYQSGIGEIWNLETRQVILKVKMDVNYIPTPSKSQLLPLSGTVDALDKVQNDNRVFLGTSIHSLSQANLILAEKDDCIVAAPISSSLAMTQDTQSAYTILFQGQKTVDIDSIYVINPNYCKYTRELKGRKLEPQKGFCVSADGRFVACLSEKFASKIIVWNCYASKGLLPDYHALHLNYKIDQKEVVLDKILPFLFDYGVSFINSLHPCGVSFLMQTIISANTTLLKMLLKYALKKEIKVSFWMLQKTSVENSYGYKNAVHVSVKQRSPESVKMILRYLLRRITYEAEVASILSESLIEVHSTYPRIFLHILHSPDLFSTLCEVEVSESGFADAKFLTETYPRLDLTEEQAERFWRTHCETKGVDSNPVTLAAVAKVFPYENACQIGHKGLLRHLLINGTHHLSFASFALKTLVNHKWRAYAKSYVLDEFGHHSLLLIVFTVYSLSLCSQDTYEIPRKSGNEDSSLVTVIPLLLSSGLAIPCLFRELNQCVLYTANHGFRGFIYWLGSAWNWMEVLSYLNVVVLIPIGQLYVLNEGHYSIILSSLVAIESLLLWSRILFYARPFRSTGPLVIVISSIVSDILPFLGLAFCVVFGFAVAFHVLYRHISNPAEVPNITNEDLELYDSLYFSFGTFGRTLSTTFRYIFGDFDLEDLYNAPESAVAVFLFVFYMAIIAIILLNMLIALMGESFSRILSDRETRFVKARATAIDEIDSMLSYRRKKQLQNRLAGYLHVAIPAFIHDRVVTGKKRVFSRQKNVLVSSTTHKKYALARKETTQPLPSVESTPTELDQNMVMGPALPQDFEDMDYGHPSGHQDLDVASLYSSSASSHGFSDDLSDS